MNMNKIRLTALAAAMAFAIAGASAAQGMSKEEYKAGKDKITAEYKADAARCGPMTGNAKDVCMAEAKGKEKVDKAELEARYKPGESTRHAAALARADADYAVAREKCDDRAGKDKDACVKDAKAAQARAKADAKGPAHASAPASKPAASASGKDSPGEYVDDAVITTKVKAAVLEEKSLKSAEINVETSHGTVQLSGFVNSRADIDRAVQVAKGVKGVKAVKNDMVLKGKQS